MIIDCTVCEGTGVILYGKRPERPCSVCSGTGQLELVGPFFNQIGEGPFRGVAGKLWVDALTAINSHAIPTNVFRSYLVLEELDATEHAALTDTQKDGVLHLLACGMVDLNDGKAGKVRLWNWFGAESTTVANLTALLT